MSDDQDKTAAAIPAWQQPGKTEDAKPDAKEETQVKAEDATEDKPEDSLKVARRFLEDEEVKNAPREKKIVFLKAKNISEQDINTLLGPESSPKSVSPPINPSFTTPNNPQTEPQPTSQTPTDRAPIVTYPEFLTPKSTPPAPLLTPTTLLRTLQGTALLSSLIYGISHFILTPQLARLNESRSDFHTHTASKITAILTKLESTVSVLPPKEEEDQDPSEMFHRDIGTQTTLPVPSSSSAPKLPPSEAQALRLEDLTRSLVELRDGLRSQSEGLGDVKATIDVFRDDLDGLTYKNTADVDGYNSMYAKKKGESQDEIRKVRDNIRRVKGVLLSTRSFPVSTR